MLGQIKNSQIFKSQRRGCGALWIPKKEKKKKKEEEEEEGCGKRPNRACVGVSIETEEEKKGFTLKENFSEAKFL